jgi:AbrB family looped-hinge helix DNA binding protein
MTTTLSSKGQIVVPRSVRTKLGLLPGTQFNVSTDGEKVVLEPRLRRRGAKLSRDRKTGLPTFTVPSGTPAITSEFVRATLADFP